MKNTITSIILFLLVFSFVAYANNSLSKLCENIAEDSENIENLINNNEWDEAYSYSLDLIDEVKNSHKLSSVYVNHTDYDYISNEAEKLSIYIREKNISEAYVSANMLRSTVHNISHLHKPSIENIF